MTISKRMLIDAAHPEETRVAIVDGNNLLQEYDFKSSFKNTVKGNVYLAKVARVEPSLQAAFVEYGGNRHGFLAFSEIHPDYFRIPVADRERIEAEIRNLVSPTGTEIENESDPSEKEGSDSRQDEDAGYRMHISTIGGEPPLHEEETENHIRKLSLHRRYKIQEVIHRNQILLIQVVKEERGGKGAALTTYLSLPGRYCVLMPNSPRSGGISRKISGSNDRTRLRKVLDSLDIPDGMGLIIRTAGKERTKAELKRDAEYLMRLWNTIRETTLKSIAPALIYEEDDIIKRAIRDLYSKDIENILVDGEEGYKIARNFMKTLMPSHIKRIQHYKNNVSPLFHHYGVEQQIDQMHEPQVVLPSGGSIVIQPTEALVSIDINSGRATRERHIEETATKTNLEAAVEIARQVRLRDLAGLIVIDFIDMSDARNVAAVERKVKEAFRHDRARIQVGKISPFGLLELSRQRLCPSIIETSAYPCPHCNATGYIRSTESKSLQVLRDIEEAGIAGISQEVMVTLPSTIAAYIFNKKRSHLATIESRHGLNVHFDFNDHLEKPGYKITNLKKAEPASALKGSRAPQPVSAAEPEAIPETTGSRKEKTGKEQHKNQNTGQNPETGGPSENNETRESSPSSRRRNRRRKSRNQDAAARETGMQDKNMPSEEGGIASSDSPSGNTPDFLPSIPQENNPVAGAGDETLPMETTEGGAEKRRRNRRRNNRRGRARTRSREEGQNSLSEDIPSLEETPTPSSNHGDYEKSRSKDGELMAPAEKNTDTGDGKSTGWWKRLLD